MESNPTSAVSTRRPHFTTLNVHVRSNANICSNARRTFTLPPHWTFPLKHFPLVPLLIPKARLPSYLRQTTRESVYLVRRGHFRSRDKTTVTPAENPTLHANFMRRTYCRSKFYIMGIGNFAFFAPATLTLTR